MQSFGIGALVIAYICVVYIGPVVALGLSIYWAYGSFQSGAGAGGSFVTFVIGALAMLIPLLVAKKLLKWLMNQVDPDEEDAAAETPSGKA